MLAYCLAKREFGDVWSQQKWGKPMRAWQRMLSGRRLNLLDPSALDVEIEDIAHGLSRVARWNGQTSGDYAFTVAQHSVLVVEILQRLRPAAPRPWLLAALLHDGAEYVIGDLISPFKAAVGLDYGALEASLQKAIHIRVGLPPNMPKSAKTFIKRADKASAYLEATQLAGFAVPEAKRFFGRFKSIDDILITPLPANDAKARFMERFADLADSMPETRCLPPGGRPVK